MGGGRVGSSMTMGLLEKSGIDVGKVHRQTSSQNEKGFYEILEMQAWWKEIFKPIKLMTFMSPVPNILAAARLTSDNKEENTRMIDKYFTDDHIAIKCSYSFPVWLFEEDEFEVTTILPTRDIKAQAASVRKWNSQDGDFETWLTKWRELIRNSFPIDLELPFEDWQKDPIETYKKLYEVVQPPKMLTPQEVLDWFDPKLIHYK